MKRIFNLVLVSILTLSISSIYAQSLELDALNMGKNYKNDIYYSLEKGFVKEIPRDNWDIAFKTSRMDATIITNGGSGVKLYAYPKGDITSWPTVDTNGLYKWKVLQNSTEFWETGGAFNQNATGATFDYGWGVYQQNNNHKVVGDSLFIIQLADGKWKKIRIDEKDSMPNIYRFTFANLDGTDEESVDISLNEFKDRQFIYYSVSDKEIKDREPKQDWDLWFTKFIVNITTESGETQQYPVVGVLQKMGVEANRFNDVDQETYVEWAKKPFEKNISTIGYDWKKFDMKEMKYTIDDKRVYFAKSMAGDVYKLFFVSFEGGETGIIRLKRGKVSAASVTSIDKTDFIQLSPNPVKDIMNLRIDGNQDAETSLKVVSVSGKVIMKRTIAAGNVNESISIKHLPKGLYMVILENGKDVFSAKLIKE
ncbi:MAG: T9SS type A sorting domain-containing protein [Bacteroidales bacterium]